MNQSPRLRHQRPSWIFWILCRRGGRGGRTDRIDRRNVGLQSDVYHRGDGPTLSLPSRSPVSPVPYYCVHLSGKEGAGRTVYELDEGAGGGEGEVREGVHGSSWGRRRRGPGANSEKGAEERGGRKRITRNSSRGWELIWFATRYETERRPAGSSTAITPTAAPQSRHSSPRLVVVEVLDARS